MPIVRLDNKGSYLLGTKVQKLQMRGKNCMVNVGGGFVTIQEYYDKYSLSQCVSLHHLMKAQNLTFNAVLLKLLQQKNRNHQYREVDDVLAKYSEQDAKRWARANDSFLTVAGFVEEKMIE